MTGAEVKKIYLEQMSSVLEPVMQRAKAAFRLCADYSVKFQYADEHSRSCVAWLEKNVGAPWVAVTEFAPTPRHHALPVPTSLILPQP